MKLLVKTSKAHKKCKSNTMSDTDFPHKNQEKQVAQ